MHYEIEPPEALRHAIRCFWFDSKDFGAQPNSFEVVPDGYAEIIFYFGSLWRQPHVNDLQPLPSPFMVGLLDQPVLFHTRNMLAVIGVRCFPWTVFDLLGLPPGKAGVRLFEHSIAALQPVLAALLEAGKWEQALDHVKQYFLQAYSRIAVDSMLFKAGNAMREANGSVPVSKVAAAAHVTVRTLERRFKHSSGYTVKDVTGLMRFEQVRNRLWLHPDEGIAGLAQEFGYADQAHLTKEFKRYSGTTPAAFARKIKKRKAAWGDDFVAFVQA